LSVALREGARSERESSSRYRRWRTTTAGQQQLTGSLSPSHFTEDDAMPAPQVHLEFADAAERAEMLTFISQWLAGPDHAELAASFDRFIGTDGYMTSPNCALTWPASPSCSATTTASNSSALTRGDGGAPPAIACLRFAR
jgi:hypothetical protein